MKKNIFTKAYLMTDLFDHTFKMLKHTWKNSLIVISLALIPISFLGLTMIQDLVQFFPKMLSNTDAFDKMAILYIFLPFAGRLLAYALLSGLLYLFVMAAITHNTFQVVKEEPVPFPAFLLTVLVGKFGKLVLQQLLYMAISIVLSMAAGLLIGLLSVLWGLITPILSAIFIIVAMLGLYGGMIWLLNSLMFIQQEVLFADTSVPSSFFKSIKLVKGNWWRVFGISLVFSIALSFATSLVTAPLSFVLMAPLSEKIMQFIFERGSTDGLIDLLTDLYANAQVPLFFSLYFTSVITALLTPVFTALFYLDLKFRKNDLPLDGEEPAPDPGVPVSEQPIDGGNADA